MLAAVAVKQEFPFFHIWSEFENACWSRASKVRDLFKKAKKHLMNYLCRIEIDLWLRKEEQFSILEQADNIKSDTCRMDGLEKGKM